MLCGEADDECCVCFSETLNKTPCGHTLCQKCWLLLPQPLCPICRREVSIIKMRRKVHGINGAERELPPLDNRSRSAITLVQAERRASSAGAQIREGRAREQPGNRTWNSSRPRALHLRLADRRLGQEPASPTSPISPSPISPMLPSLRRTRRANQSDPGSPLPGLNGPVRMKELEGRINRITMTEVPRLLEHLHFLRAQNRVVREDADSMWSCMRKRVAELLSRARHDEMETATSLYTACSSDNDVSGDGTPRRAYEARLTYLVQHPAGVGSDPHVEFDALYNCHRHACEMVSRGLASIRVQEFAVERIERWFEGSSMVVLADRPREISEMVMKAPQLYQSLLKRLTSLTRQNLQSGQLHLYASALFRLESHDVHILSGELEDYIVKFMRSSIDSWPRARLLLELFNQSVRELCETNEKIGRGVRTAFGRRLGKDILVMSTGLQKKSDAQISQEMTRIQAEFKEWTDLVKRAHGAQMMDFDATTRKGVMDSLSACVERCLEGGHGLDGPTEELNQMQWSTMLLLGGPNMSRDGMARTY